MTDNIQYTLRLTTGSEKWSGTDEDIYIQVTVEKDGVVQEKTNPAYIDDPTTDDFETGTSKSYNFQAMEIDYTHVYLALVSTGTQLSGDLWKGWINEPVSAKQIDSYPNSKSGDRSTWVKVRLASYHNESYGPFPSTMPSGLPGSPGNEQVPSWKLHSFNLSGAYSELHLAHDRPEFVTDQWLTRGTILHIERQKFKTRP